MPDLMDVGPASDSDGVRTGGGRFTPCGEAVRVPDVGSIPPFSGDGLMRLVGVDDSADPRRVLATTKQFLEPPQEAV